MNIEQLIKLFGEQPDLFSATLKHIATTEEGKEFLNNYAKTVSDKAIGDKETQIFGDIDTAIKEVLGTDRPTEKQVKDYLKDLASELKDLKAKKGKGGNDAPDATRITELEAELKAFKDANWEAKYNQLATETSSKLTDYQTRLEKAEAEKTTGAVSVELSNGLAGLKFNPNIPQNLVDNFVGTLREKVTKNAKVVDGKTVFYKEDGTPWLNELFKPITAKEIFATELKDVVVGEKNKGGGAAPEAGKIITIGEGKDAKKKVALDPTQFNTKLGFADHAEKVLLENGIEKGSKEWNDITTEAYNEYGVDKMERL